MIVKFKSSQEPCITYKVINDNPVWEFDEYFGKYMECIEIEVIGLTPKELLTEANPHPENVKAIDLAIKLSNQSK